MNEYLFSPSENMFYPLALKDDYIKSGSWPSDGIEVDNSIFIEFTGTTPEDKVRGVGVDGDPVWKGVVTEEE